jgi:predicted RNA-binding protein YlqC (UPF0109 family)
VSAFDDEFGLFGDDEPAPDEERKPTLGARQIATGETIIDDIEPEDERPARRRPSSASAGQRERTGGERRPYHDRDHGPRTTGDPALAQARAVELLRYLAQKLVSRPDDVMVAVVDGQRGPVIELEVHPDDFGKVIGKGGRVAQALRTIVRASAEGKVTIDIVEVEDDDEHEADLEHAGDTAAPHDEAEAVAAGAIVADDDEPEELDDEAPAGDDAPVDDAVAAPPAAKKAPAARKKRAAATPAKRKKKS